MTKYDLFMELCGGVDADGKSRWVSVDEYIGKYKDLKHFNGLGWARRSSRLGKEFNIRVDRSQTVGNRIDRIKLDGFNTSSSRHHTQSIRADIKKTISAMPCAILDTKVSCDHKVEVDHKDGRKVDDRVMNTKTQKLSDFQPLSKPANDAKREHCNKCKASGCRYDAKRLGYSKSVWKGSVEYDDSIGCEGCYWYCPFTFNKEVSK